MKASHQWNRKSEINGLEKDLSFWTGMDGIAWLHVFAYSYAVGAKFSFPLRARHCPFFSYFYPNKVSDVLAYPFLFKKGITNLRNLSTFQIISTMVRNCSVQGQIQGLENKECQQWSGEEMPAKSRKKELLQPQTLWMSGIRKANVSQSTSPYTWRVDWKFKFTCS